MLELAKENSKQSVYLDYTYPMRWVKRNRSSAKEEAV